MRPSLLPPVFESDPGICTTARGPRSTRRGPLLLSSWQASRCDMTPNTSTHSLMLTRRQADYLLHLVTIAELAIAEHNRTDWLPSGQGDATLMRTHLQAIRGAVSLEQPLRDLATWLKKAGG